MSWIKSFRYQVWQYRRFRFGFFESLYWAARKATDVERSVRSFSEWQATQQGVHLTKSRLAQFLDKLSAAFRR